MATSQNPAVEAMKSRARSILVADLKNICRDEGLQVSGAKNILQNRITQRIDQMLAQGNMTGLQSMRTSLEYTGSGRPLPPLQQTSTSSSSSSARGFGGGSSAYTNGFGMARNNFQPGIQFRPSPFYEVLEPVQRPLEMPAFPNHRNAVTISFVLSDQNIQRMRSDSSIRILLYCASKADALPGQAFDVAFPPQLEVKVNEQEVKANFKGLKNKAGSTRPADITGFVTKQPNYTNRILVTYALTQKEGDKPSSKDLKGYTMVATLVKKRSVDELVARISRGKVISRERVLSEMQLRAKDPDIVVGDSTFNLKDPVSYTRIGVPCRSDVCTHHQCFDAASFLQLQEQAPTWTCPICNKTVSFEGLVVDKYFEHILQNTSSSTSSVTVDPSGNWSTGAAPTSRQNGTGGAHSDDDDSDDDLIEVVRPAPIKRESFASASAISAPFAFAVPTPPRMSPAVGASAFPAVRQGHKRKSEVIDLTLSDDDEPIAKRPAYHTPNSLPDHSRLGRSNGYSSSYPNNPSSFGNRANGPLRFQLGTGREGVSGGNNSTYINNYENNSSGGSSRHEDDGMFSFSGAGSFPSSRAGHRPSPLSGSALAPINLDESPPHRPPSGLAPYSAGSSTTGFGGQLPTLSSLDFGNFPSPPPIPQSAHHTQNANSHYGPGQQSEQRAMLRQLANPFGAYSPDEDDEDDDY